MDALRDLNLEQVRRAFPGLERQVDGRPAVFLDGPAGSQVPRSVIEAVAGSMAHHNANSGGTFVTSEENDAMLATAHRAVADLLGVDDPDLVVFGPNMTTLALALARAIARTWNPKDEILVSRLEHDANFTPWVQAARDAGAKVLEVVVRERDCTLDLDDLKKKLSPRTRFVAVGAASNAVGTINPLRAVADLAHAAGAKVFVDAVHYAPHLLMDVPAWNCDFVACSAYKFFGPHVGMLWGRRSLMESLPVYKLRPPSNAMPHRWMTGTPPHEGIAGTLAAVEYLAGLGGTAPDRRAGLSRSFRWIAAHERDLVLRLIAGLESLPGVRVWGITDPERVAERVPTVSFTHLVKRPRTIAAELGRRGIFVWHGNYYALPLTESLGLEPEGMVRVGILHYNTAAEVNRLIEALREIL